MYFNNQTKKEKRKKKKKETRILCKSEQWRGAMTLEMKAGWKEFLKNINLHGGLNYFVFLFLFWFCLYFILLDSFYCKPTKWAKNNNIIIITSIITTKKKKGSCQRS